jgi:hypothetical protein
VINTGRCARDLATVGFFAKFAKSGYELRHVCLSVLMEQLFSSWMDLHEIGCVSIFRKYIEKIQISLK